MATLSRLSELNSNAVIPLPHFGVVSLKGEQCDEYLHGQLTVNTKTLTDSQVRHAAHCDFKGKAWALMTVLRHQDQVLLLMNTDALQHSLAQLQKYGVFSKVDIEDASATYSQWFVTGEKAQAHLKSHFPTLPDTAMSSVQSESGVVFRTDFPANGYWVITQDADALITPIRNDDGITEYGQEVFEAISIANGQPDVSGESVNQFVPQMMNLQALSGIDFDKGCYMGQEVVARTRFLGKNKRAAYSFCVPGATSVAVDGIVEKQVGENWRRGGTIIRAASLGEESWIMAVLNNDTQPQDKHRLAASPDLEFTPMTLPYSVEEEKGSNIKGRK
ncbi:YgfZ/GcvT domain-containing protein [Alteromonas antoniana]|uniref:CAF17-like 4Fe-4S cluster assembly/insertion protein YgfZ n=1 Tax=Alteromonas antoniana TaxID=2803813 RepID=UPI001C4744ED|nr:glycine cleavage system protein T [Alteromonas antoniana]